MANWSVRALIPNNVSLTTCPVAQDGITLAIGDRVLLTGQTAAAENGIYTFGTVAGGNAPLTRATDANGTPSLGPETAARVSEGSLYAHTEWALSTSGPITLGTTALTFAKILAGAAIPPPALVATSNIALTGVVTVDGVASNTIAGGVLCTAQTAPADNGYWTPNAGGAWTRPPYYNSDAAVAAALGQVSAVALGGTLNKGQSFIAISGGTLAGGKIWVPSRPLVEIDVCAQPWGIKADGNDETAKMKAVFDYCWSINAAGGGSMLLLPGRMIRVGEYLKAATRGALTGNPALTFVNVGASGDTVTRATGSWITDQFQVGDLIRITGTASNNVTGVIAALSATVLTFGTTALTNEGPVSGVAVSRLEPQGCGVPLIPYMSIRGINKFASGFLVNNAVPIHGMLGSGDLNSGGIAGASYRDFEIYNNTCYWHYGGMQIWQPSFNYASTPVGTYVRPAKPSNILLKLTTTLGVSGAYRPIGELYSIAGKARMLGTAATGHATVYKITTGGFFGFGNQFQVSTDGGNTWGAVQTPARYDYCVVDLSAYLGPSGAALGASVYAKIGNGNWPASFTTTTNGVFVQPGLGSNVAITMTAVLLGGVAQFGQYTIISVAGSGLYEVQSVAGSVLTCKLWVAYPGGTGGTGRAVTVVQAVAPRVEVISAPTAADQSVDIWGSGGGPLGLRNPGNWRLTIPSQLDPNIYTTALALPNTGGGALTGNPNLTFVNAGATDTITRSAGSWITDGFQVGESYVITGSASNNVTVLITALSATVLSTTSSLTNEGPVAGIYFTGAPIGPVGGTVTSAYTDVTYRNPTYGTVTVRFHGGIQQSLPDILYYTPAFGWSMESTKYPSSSNPPLPGSTTAPVPGTFITDGGNVWEVVEAPDAIRLDGVGFAGFHSVVTVGGNCGYAISESENVGIEGDYYCNAWSLAAYYISNGELRMGEGGQFANSISIGGTSSLYGDGYGVIDSGGLGHVIAGQINYQLCPAGWCYLAGLYGATVHAGYIETAGGYLRNSAYLNRVGSVQGIQGMNLTTGYAGSIAGNYFLDCYGAAFNFDGVYVGGALAGFGFGIYGNGCFVTGTGSKYPGGYLIDNAPAYGHVTDIRNSATWRGRLTEVQVPSTYASLSASNVEMPVWSSDMILIAGGLAAHGWTIHSLIPRPNNLVTPAMPAGLRDGQVVRFTNFTGFWGVIKHGSATGGVVAANKIYTLNGDDLYLPGSFSPFAVSWVELVYYVAATAGTAGWYVRSHSPTVQTGVATLVAGVTATIAAAIKSNSRIFITQKTPSGTSLTTEYAALTADRVNGVLGTFKVTALLAAGTINTADTSTVEWMVTN